MKQEEKHFGLSSLFVFGQDIDAEATKAMDVATKALARATSTLDSSKAKAKASLERLDEMRAILYRDSLSGFFSLYDSSLSGLKDIPPNTSQANRFIATSPSFAATAQLSEPHPAWKKGLLAVLFGSASTLIIFQILVLIDLQQPIALTAIAGVLLGLLFEMTLCYRRAQGNLAAAASYLGQVKEHEEKAIRFSTKVEQLINDYPVAMDALQRKATRLNQQVESLNDVVRDSTNAAELLLKLVRMPLIDGEGALLADVMQQLREDAAAAKEMQAQLGIEDKSIGMTEESELET